MTAILDLFTVPGALCWKEIGAEPQMVAKKADAPQEAANENSTSDQDALGLTALAEGVIAREFRPRVSTVRRLAKAVLALQGDVAELRKAGRKAAKAKAVSGKSAKKGNKKKRKLAKIPGQKGK
tara:strand:+ start:30274 stop:30645 length:372 start_codon:yes stop_codon:yes gene_type:complete